jgi:hypothetical protein
MGAAFQTAISVVGAVLVLFGGLAFWPLVRFGGGVTGGAADLLKWQFYSHILLLAGAFVLLQYLGAIDHPYGAPLRIVPYAIGGVSWMAALITLFCGGLWRRLGDDSGSD